MKHAILIFSLFIGSYSFADDTENVYIKLYRQRLEISKIEVKKQLAQLELDLKTLDRMEKLHGRSMVTDQALDEHRSNARISELNVEDLKVKVMEAQAMLDIAKERINLGLDMPICPSVSQ
ncbi:MAG: hypothetical protein R3B45_03865 [Bdellovibrionota bacterium]